jgi:hypothetical protein
MMPSRDLAPMQKCFNVRWIRPAYRRRQSGYSRQHGLRPWKRRLKPMWRCIAAIPAPRLLGEHVRASGLFNFATEQRRHST